MREFAVWWTIIALQLTILGRAASLIGRNKYPFFDGQLGCSFLAGCVGLWIFIVVPVYFRGAYWDIELATALTGCGVLIEILHQAFLRNGPASLFGRTARGLVYITVGLFGILFALSVARNASLAHLFLLERDFRLVQTAVPLSVVAAIFYLPLGRNLNGMLVGYGIFIARDLVTLALKSRFPISFSSGVELPAALSLHMFSGGIHIRPLDVRARPAARVIACQQGTGGNSSG